MYPIQPYENKYYKINYYYMTQGFVFSLLYRSFSEWFRSLSGPVDSLWERVAGFPPLYPSLVGKLY